MKKKFKTKIAERVGTFLDIINVVDGLLWIIK